MKSVKFVLILLLVLGFLLGLGLSVNALIAAKKQQLSQAPKYGESPVPIHGVTSTVGDFIRGKDYLAIVEPMQKAEINARVQSTIERILVDEGSVINAGDLLLQLDNREVKATIESVVAQVAQVQAEVSSNTALIQSLKDSAEYWEKETERDKSLAQSGAIPVSQAEKTRDQYIQTHGKLESAQEQSKALVFQRESLAKKKQELEITLDYYSITSPYSGVVTQRYVDHGDIALPGKSLLQIEDRSSLKLSFWVPQDDAPEVKEGMEVQFNIQGRQEKGSLSHLFPALNEARMLRAEVFLPTTYNEILKSGQYVPVTVTLKHWTNVTLLPVSAILHQGKEDFVYRVNENHLEKKTVKILGNNGDQAAVDGIGPNTQVVESAFLGWAKLSAGLLVEIYP